MIEALLRVVAPCSLWGERLADLLAQHPKVRLDRLDFPAGWQQRAVWTGCFFIAAHACWVSAKG